MKKNLSKHASLMGKKGGKTTGPTKARHPDHYAAISRAYWQKRRTFMVTFLSMSDSEKLTLFQHHGLTGENQTAVHLWANMGDGR
jgi:hypothetical protein